MSLKTVELQKLLVPLHEHYVGRTFQHYRGGVYKVLGVVFDTFHDAPALRYCRVDGMHFNQKAESQIEFTRLLEDWEAEVTRVDAPPTKRFVEVDMRPAWIAI